MTNKKKCPKCGDSNIFSSVVLPKKYICASCRWIWREGNEKKGYYFSQLIKNQQL